MLARSKNGFKYVRVKLTTSNRSTLVNISRLVMQAQSGEVVKSRNGDPLDLRQSNLFLTKTTPEGILYRNSFVMPEPTAPAKPVEMPQEPTEDTPEDAFTYRLFFDGGSSSTPAHPASVSKFSLPTAHASTSVATYSAPKTPPTTFPNLVDLLLASKQPTPSVSRTSRFPEIVC